MCSLIWDFLAAYCEKVIFLYCASFKEVILHMCMRVFGMHMVSTCIVVSLSHIIWWSTLVLCIHITDMLNMCIKKFDGLGSSVGCASNLWSGGCGFDPHWVGNILSWRLIVKYFLRSFSPFRWFKKGSCQFLVKECAQYWLTAKRTKPVQ